MVKKKDTGISSDAMKALDSLDKMNPLAGFLSESTLSNVSDYHDTGCLVLNSIISGSLYKGVPQGRITGFAGPSMAGKTFIECIVPLGIVQLYASVWKVSQHSIHYGYPLKVIMEIISSF